MSSSSDSFVTYRLSFKYIWLSRDDPVADKIEPILIRRKPRPARHIPDSHLVFMIGESDCEPFENPPRS